MYIKEKISCNLLRSKLLCAIALSGLLIGCGQISEIYMVDSLVRGDDYREIGGLTSTRQYIPDPINLNADTMTSYSRGDDKPRETLTKPVIEIANTDTHGRNDAMDFLIGRSNLVCDKHTAAIISGSSTTNFVLAEVTTLLSGLGSLFTAESTIRALSGSAAITNATRAQYNEAFFQNMLNSTIVSAIRESRKILLAEMEVRRTSDLNAYSGYQMIDDVIQYHLACSFYSGLVALKEAAQKIRPTTADVGLRINSVRDQLTNIRGEITRAASARDTSLAQDLKNVEKALVAEYQRLVLLQTSARSQ